MAQYYAGLIGFNAQQAQYPVICGMFIGEQDSHVLSKNGLNVAPIGTGNCLRPIVLCQTFLV